MISLFVSPYDIRDIQMAGCAIRAGMETMLREWGASWDDVGKVYLAGGSGYYLGILR